MPPTIIGGERCTGPVLFWKGRITANCLPQMMRRVELSDAVPSDGESFEAPLHLG
ncbi:hypothetical protein ABIC30_006446 [Methylobacterium sp. 1030]